MLIVSNDMVILAQESMSETHGIGDRWLARPYKAGCQSSVLNPRMIRMNDDLLQKESNS